MTHYKRIYGLTGGIATGKTTVTKILRDMNYKVIDSDKIAHEVILKGNSAYNDLIKSFGKDILDSDGEIHRGKLGNRVFGNREKLDELNSITHPHIISEIKEEADKILDTEDIVFIDMPLLYEIEDSLKKYDFKFDEIILVYLEEDRQIKRLMERDNISREEALKKIESQISIEDKLDKTRYVIDNNGKESELIYEIQKILRELKK